MDSRTPADHCDSYRVFVVLPVESPVILLQQQQQEQQQGQLGDGGGGCVPSETPTKKKPTTSSPSTSKKVRSTRMVRHAYTAEDKTDAVTKVLAGSTILEVAKEKNIPDSTLRGWMKKSCKIVQLGDRWTCIGDPVDICTHKWFLQRCGLGLSVSNLELREQAQRFRSALKDSGIEIDCGWVTRWKRNNSVRDFREALVIEVGDEQRHEFLRDLDQYSDEQIYNCNEMILFYAMLPKLDPTAVDDEPKFTLLFCVNKSGKHKLKPLCIGNDLKDYNERMDYLPNNKSWIDRDIFSFWFNQFFVPAVREHLLSNKLEPKALLILDNCSAHQPALASDDGLIKTKFFIKSLPTTYQPIEHVLQFVKRNYRTNLLQHLIHSELPPRTFVHFFNYQKFTSFLINAWNRIGKDQIVSGWKRCFLFNSKGQFAEHPNVISALNINIDRLRSKLRLSKLTPEMLEDWSVIEKDSPKCQSLTDQEIIESIVEEQHEPPEKKTKTAVEDRPVICSNVRPVEWRKRPDSAIKSYYQLMANDIKLDSNHENNEEQVHDDLQPLKEIN